MLSHGQRKRKNAPWSSGGGTPKFWRALQPRSGRSLRESLKRSSICLRVCV